jgi:SAM-dependent methyltransferase
MAVYFEEPEAVKARESGMPEEAMWEGFFNPPATLAALGLTPQCCDAVEFGCGYGTFTLPAARIVSGTVYAFDIEPEMTECTIARAQAAGLPNIITCLRDFMAEGTGLTDASIDYAMLFNILHCEGPESLLQEARRVVRWGGTLGLMHWNYDATTPRGPSMAIRPRPEQCRSWAENAGFTLLPPGVVNLPPYHYGMVFRKQGARQDQPEDHCAG